jgi:class 3 adenylate cyclase
MPKGLSVPIRFGIGINGGEVIVGDIGYGENITFTALGVPAHETGVASGINNAVASLASLVAIALFSTVPQIWPTLNWRSRMPETLWAVPLPAQCQLPSGETGKIRSSALDSQKKRAAGDQLLTGRLACFSTARRGPL